MFGCNKRGKLAFESGFDLVDTKGKRINHNGFPRFLKSLYHTFLKTICPDSDIVVLRFRQKLIET